MSTSTTIDLYETNGGQLLMWVRGAGRGYDVTDAHRESTFAADAAALARGEDGDWTVPQIESAPEQTPTCRRVAAWSTADWIAGMDPLTVHCDAGGLGHDEDDHADCGGLGAAARSYLRDADDRAGHPAGIIVGADTRTGCASCQSHTATRGDYCDGCAHAVDVHGASRTDAYAVECTCTGGAATIDLHAHAHQLARALAAECAARWPDAISDHAGEEAAYLCAVELLADNPDTTPIEVRDAVREATVAHARDVAHDARPDRACLHPDASDPQSSGERCGG